MPSKYDTCSNCYYWSSEKLRTLGKCVLNPPIVINDHNGYGTTVWPYTEPNDWCGRHQQDSSGT